MATKKTIYQDIKDSPDSWLQAAVDAKEISEAERDAIQKFLDSQTREEAQKQIDFLKQSMASRPEFALSPEERTEMLDTAKALQEARIRAQQDITEYRALAEELKKSDPDGLLQATEEAMERARQELDVATKKYNACNLVLALSTSEQAQEYANKWYEDIGRQQGRHLLEAISEFSQSIAAQIRGDKEQAQEHMTKSQVALHGSKEVIARKFEKRAEDLIPDKKELKERNKIASELEKKISKVNGAAKAVRNREAELIKAAQAIATSEWKYRNRFGNLSSWAQGKPVDKTFQEIKTYEQAIEFMKDRRPDEVARIEALLREDKAALEKATAEMKTALDPVLADLQRRQESLKEFVIDYEQAIAQGYVDDARADAIAQNLDAAQQYAKIVDAEWLQTFRTYGVDIDARYINPFEPIEQEVPTQENPEPVKDAAHAEPTQDVPETPTGDKKDPTQTGPADGNSSHAEHADNGTSGPKQGAPTHASSATFDWSKASQNVEAQAQAKAEAERKAAERAAQERNKQRTQFVIYNGEKFKLRGTQEEINQQIEKLSKHGDVVRVTPADLHDQHGRNQNGRGHGPNKQDGQTQGGSPSQDNHGRDEVDHDEFDHGNR